MRFHGCGFPAIARRHNLTKDILVQWILKYFCPLFHEVPWALSQVVEQPYTQSHNIYNPYKMPTCQIVYFHWDLPKHRTLEARQVEAAEMAQH